MALPDDKRPGKRGAVACLPAARSHEEPDPGGFRCISTKTDPEHSGPFVVQESVVALPDDKRPEKRGAVSFPPAALGHEEPGPGGFKCISTKNPYRNIQAPTFFRGVGVALPDGKQPE